MSLNELRNAAGGQQPEGGNAYQLFMNQLERSKPQLLGLMNNDKNNVDKFCAVLQRAVLANMALLDADRKSLLAAALKCAQDGLVPDGREAVLNIRNQKVPPNWDKVRMVVYEPMVAGYIKNLYEHPDIVSVDAAAVFANDVFKFVRGDDPKLEHEPTITGDPGDLIAAYVCIKLRRPNGAIEVKREVMPKRDIDKVRGSSSNTSTSEANPWVKWGDQMAIKSVIKRGAKQVPRSNKFESMDRHDNELYVEPPPMLASAPQPPAPTHAHPPAIELDPSPIIEPELQQGQQEAVEPPAPSGDSVTTLRTREGAEDVGDMPKLTAAQLEERLRGTRDKDVADIVMQDVYFMRDNNSLTVEEAKHLGDVYSQLFEPGAAPPTPTPMPTPGPTDAPAPSTAPTPVPKGKK